MFIDPNMAALAKNPTEENRAFLMHMTLNSIRSYVVKYGKTYGKMVIALDGKNTWRRQKFPNYKITRSASREKSDIDWDYVYSVGNDIKDALRTKLPFAVVGMDGAEADDVIACLVKHVSEKSNDDEDFGGMLGNDPEPIIILSSDGDFKQLHKYKNVKQWSPMLKKQITCAKPELELLEKIIKGDVSDSIPNIKTHDNFFKDKIENPEIKHRQTVITAKYLEKLLKNPTAFDTVEEKHNFDRNKMLISFDSIPPELYNQIVTAYTEQLDKKISKLELMNFFIGKRLNQLNENIQDFFIGQ